MATSIALASDPYGSVDLDANSIDWSNTINVSGVFLGSEVTISPTQYSDYVVASGLGFSIPNISTIDGIVISLDKYCDFDTGIQDHLAFLFNSGSRIDTTIGGNRAKGGFWPDTQTSYTYGSPTDLWNCTLTPSVINSSTFGFGLCVKWGDIYPQGTNTAYVFADMEFTVYYSINSFKFGSTSLINVYAGSSQVKNIYLGTTDLATNEQTL